MRGLVDEGHFSPREHKGGPEPALDEDGALFLWLWTMQFPATSRKEALAGISMFRGVESIWHWCHHCDMANHRYAHAPIVERACAPGLTRAHADSKRFHVLHALDMRAGEVGTLVWQGSVNHVVRSLPAHRYHLIIYLKPLNFMNGQSQGVSDSVVGSPGFKPADHLHQLLDCRRLLVPTRSDNADELLEAVRLIRVRQRGDHARCAFSACT